VPKTEISKLKTLVEIAGWKKSPSLQAHSICWLRDNRHRLGKEAYTPLTHYLAEKLDITIDRLQAIITLQGFQETARALATPKTPLPRSPEDLVYPTTGWLGAYLNYAQGNEAPGAFHFWTGASVLGAACRRNFYIDQGSFFIYPNLYVLIISPSGSKKSSSLVIGQDILERLNLQLLDEGVDPRERIRISPKKVAPERFFHLLKAEEIEDDIDPKIVDSVAFLGITELVILLGKSVFHADQMIHLLTELWDCPEKYEVSTFVRGNEVLRNVAISLVACTTEAWLYDSAQEDIFTGGFMGRCVVVPRGYSNRVYAKPEPLDPVQANELSKWLVSLSTSKTTQLTIKGWDWYQDWYEKNKQIAAGQDDRKMEGYFNRRDVHLLKIAMLIALSEGHKAILEEDLKVALKILEHEEKFLPNVLNKVGVHPKSKTGEEVLDYLTRKGDWVTRSTLCRATWRATGGAHVLDRIMDDLLSQDRVEKDRAGRATIWKAKEPSL
jgi:hypothetical protein